MCECEKDSLDRPDPAVETPADGERMVERPCLSVRSLVESVLARDQPDEHEKGCDCGDDERYQPGPQPEGASRRPV